MFKDISFHERKSVSMQTFVTKGSANVVLLTRSDLFNVTVKKKRKTSSKLSLSLVNGEETIQRT